MDLDFYGSPSKRSKRLLEKSRKVVTDDDDSSGDFIFSDDSMDSHSSKASGSSAKSGASTGRKRKRKDSTDSSDEERWLTAIESGKLEDVDDELRKLKIKDPSLMTARQRAMYDRNDGYSNKSSSSLMSLPTGYKEKVMTAEAIQKAAVKSQRRKQQADEKREKDKKKTMERLLKKQETKANKMQKPKAAKSVVPSIIYRQNIYQTTLTFPESISYPLKPQKIPTRPIVKYCSMGCGNPKKYACSQTGADLCSLACYKLNMAKKVL